MNAPEPTWDEPLVVLSDLHLSRFGRWRKRFARLRPLWGGAGTIVFNGDTINWSPPAYRCRIREMLDQMSGLCAEDGARAVFLTGNCDYYIESRGYLSLADGRILITHGEVIFPDICPWRRQAPGMRRERDSALSRMSPQRRATLAGQVDSVREALTAVQAGRLKPALRIRELRRLLEFTSRPGQLWRALRAWRRAPALAARFFEQYRPQAKVIIIGHTHWPGLWDLNDRIIINTGSPGWPGGGLLARVETGRVSVQRIAGRQGHYRPGRTIAGFSVG